jgi:sphingosine kinase
MGSSPPEVVIPYYNILWATAENQIVLDSKLGVDNHLVVDYAVEISKTQLRRATLQYPFGKIPIATAQKWIETLLQHAYGQAQQQRRAKVLVNPHAGPGGAVQIWEREVKPFFEAARMTLDVVQTSHGGEGAEICEALDINAYDVVVVCSGDGLAYEAFNGFGKRADARNALRKVAVAHIPCGSGNAMSCNLNGSNYPGPSALAVIKGVRTNVDLMSVTQGSQRLLSFLSQSVGIIAECDLGTEHMRWMGAKRFDVGVVQRIFSKKVYPCDIAVKVEIENKAQVKAHYKRNRNGEEQNYKREDGESTADISMLTDGSGVGTGEGLPPLRFGTVNNKIPDDWEKASYDKLGNFYCGNVSFALRITSPRRQNSMNRLLILGLDGMDVSYCQLLPGGRHK